MKDSGQLADGQLHLEIAGISCAACVGRIERLLAGRPDVVRAQVNLATRSAEITLAQGAAGAPLAEALAAAGYQPAIRDVTLAVAGMTCAACVGRVERALSALPQVLEARANLADHTLRVRHLGGEDAALIATLARAGYGARVQADDAADTTRAEAQAAGRTAALAALAGLPVFAMEMGGHAVPALHHWLGMTLGAAMWPLQALLTLLVMAGPGRSFYRRGLPALMRGAPDMNSLVALGTLAALAYSLVATFAPALMPDAARAVYYESAVMIVVLILTGRWLEARARGRTGAAIARLVGLQPQLARVERGGRIDEVPVAAVLPGDLVHLRPGERVPVDGKVRQGCSAVDESMLTGEALAVDKAPGAEVTGGSVNGHGALLIEATRVGAEARLAQIIRMVAAAQGARLPVQALVDRITGVFVPAVLGVAALALAVWLALGPEPRLAHALSAAVAVLIIACPCAMGLATPVSIMVGTGRAADAGILFRGGNALQALAGIRMVAFDKTGTLTRGRPDLVALVTAPGVKPDEALALAAALEAQSEHPVAHAILRAAAAQGLDPRAVSATGVAAVPGRGVQGRVGGAALRLGAAAWAAGRDAGLDPGPDLGPDPGNDAGALAPVLPDPIAAAAASEAAAGRTLLFLAREGQVLALLAVADQPRPEAAAAVAALRARGFGVAMISGDGDAAARHCAQEIGIGTVFAGVLPEGKLAVLSQLRATHGAVAFVGDGINDAPALAGADVGIAIGTGTDVAIESADVVLMAGNPAAVAEAIAIAQATLANIRQNLGWAFGYNVALIPVAAGLLYPVWGVMLSPVLAAAAMAASSLFVLGNALRLQKRAIGAAGRTRRERA